MPPTRVQWSCGRCCLAALMGSTGGCGHPTSRGHKNGEWFSLQLFWFVLFRVRTDLISSRRHFFDSTRKLLPAGLESPPVFEDSRSQNNAFGSWSWQSLCNKTTLLVLMLSPASQHVEFLCLLGFLQPFGSVKHKILWGGVQFYTFVSKLVMGKNQFLNFYLHMDL